MRRRQYLLYGLIFLGPLAGIVSLALIGLRHSAEAVLSVFLVLCCFSGLREKTPTGLVQPDATEYGPTPGYRLVSGLFVYSIGSVFSVLGIGFIGIIDKQEPTESIAEKAVVGLLFLFFGALALLAGLRMIIKRNRLKIVLAEEALHVADVFRQDDIPYSQIRNVVKGFEAVVLEVDGRCFFYPISDNSPNRTGKKKHS
jgi:hypothetical protein